MEVIGHNQEPLVVCAGPGQWLQWGAGGPVLLSGLITRPIVLQQVLQQVVQWRSCDIGVCKYAVMPKKEATWIAEVGSGTR